MSRSDVFLSRLSGISVQNWEDANPSPSMVQIGPTATSTPKGERICGGLLGGDKSNGVLEDSGYESPPSNKVEEEEQQPLPQDSTTDLEGSRRTSSAPMPKIRSSRIPISTSSTKIGPKGSGTNWSGRSSVDLLRLVHPKIPAEAAFGDQGNDTSLLTCTEENFLRLTKSRGTFRGPPSTAPPSTSSSSQGVFSNSSVSSLRHWSARNVTDSSHLLMKMPPPRFMRSRSSAPFSAQCLSTTGQFPSSPAIALPSYHTMLERSESFQTIKSLVDKNVHEILQEGESEFGGKYSEWIQQVFNLQLEKIHNRLRGAYTEKLKESLELKESHVLEMKTTYRTKLLEFEEATKKFQYWYDEVIQENQAQVAANQVLTKQLQEKEANLRRQYEADTESKLIQLESTFQLERQKELARHAEQLRQVGEKGEAQNQMIVEQYQHQIDCLKVQIEAYKNHNATLHEKYTEQRKAEAEARRPDLNANDPREEPIREEELNDPEREELRGQIRALEQEVEELMAKNQEMNLEHSEEVIKLQNTLELNNQKIRVVIKEARQEIEGNRRDRERGIREMQLRIRAKEEGHRREMSQLTERYGKKIEELTTSVQLLQNQLVREE